MSGFDPALSALAGNRALKDQLIAQAAGRGLSHAYLIGGPEGSGKRTLAGLLAAAYVCTAEHGWPCGQCAACRKVANGIHPDITWVGEPDKDITVAMVRQVRSDAYIRPNEAHRKVYIFPDAQRMNASAQNAILKLLEDGPAYAAFLLLADNAAALLPTIRSRCEGLGLSPVTPQEAEAVLREKFPDRDPSELSAAAHDCDGLIGRAVQVLEGNDGAQAAEAARKLVALLAAQDELGMARLCVSLEKWEREALTELFARTALLLRHALAIQSGAGHTVEERERANAAPAAGLSRRALLDAAGTLDKLRAAAAFNVGTGHLSGALCAGLIQAGRRTPSQPGRTRYLGGSK